MRQLLRKGISLAVILAASAIPCAAIGGFGITNNYVSQFAGWSAESNVTAVVGDYDGDGMSDIALTGNSSWTSLRLAISNGDGTYQIIDTPLPTFAYWASQTGAKPFVGDFNGDKKSDIALLGNPYWNFMPMAISDGNGNFTYYGQYIGKFAEWASYPANTLCVGDFNADGKTDIALTGETGWNSVPVAFSLGNGNFNVTNFSLSNFPTWASLPNVKALVGDYNHDDMADIALTGYSMWGSVPVAFSDGTGHFNVTNDPVANFPGWASQTGVKPLVGDYNHDGNADIALLGNASWGSVPVAFSNGNGYFNVTNQSVGSFSTLAADPGVKILVGDFNGDQKTDLALTGVSGWYYIPVAFSVGNGDFAFTTTPILSFGGWASVANPLLGDVNGDHKADIALTGNASWSSIPVAFSLTPD